MTRTIQITSAQFRAGMVLHFHGARFRLRDDVKAHYHANAIGRRDYNMERPVFTATGDWLDGDEVRGYFGRDLPWRFQGNDLAVWAAEV